LAATDLSSHSDGALRQAHLRALADGSQLAVCHVVPTLVGVNMLFPQRAVQQGDAQLALRTQAEDLLFEQVSRVTGRGAHELVSIVAEGVPYAAIVEEAERAGAELVVLGDSGEGDLAERVVRYAHCPVLIVRSEAEVLHIMVATDLSDPSLPALGATAREAARTGARVTALHCLEMPLALVGPEHGLAVARAVPPQLAAEVRAHAEQHLSQALRDAGLAAEQRVVEGSPASAIVRAAEDGAADLVVIGTRGRTGLTRVVLGSVAESVVRNASCSVLAVRLAATRTA